MEPNHAALRLNGQKPISGGNYTMKKIISLVLAAVLALSLAACGNKNNGGSGDQPYAPTSALDLLEKVWNSYTDEDKFPTSGGDYSEANSKEDAPGV